MWPTANGSRSGSCPLFIVPFEEWVFWRAVRIKAEHPLSYADAFAASLALDREATLLTADPEFESLGERLPRIPV